MTRKLPVDAGWTIVRREGQGISSVPGAKWLIKPGEIQLGAFNTYRARRVGSNRRNAARRRRYFTISRGAGHARNCAHLPRFISDEANIRGQTERSFEKRACSTNKQAGVALLRAGCTKHACRIPRIERRYGPIQKARHRLINERARTMR